MMTHDKFANMTLREHSHVATTHAKCPAYIHTRLHIHSLSQCSFVIVVLHVTYVGSVLWNEIPQLLKNPMSKYTFKRKLKAHLLNEQAIF